MMEPAAILHRADSTTWREGTVSWAAESTQRAWRKNRKLAWRAFALLARAQSAVRVSGQGLGAAPDHLQPADLVRRNGFRSRRA